MDPKTDSFPIHIIYSKSISGKHDDEVLLVANDQLLSSIAKIACKKAGIMYSEKYEFISLSKAPFSMKHTVHENLISENDNLILTFPEKENDSNNSFITKTYRTMIWKPLAIIGFLLSVFGLIILITIYAINVSSIFTYSVVIDAGSTSSKIYLYYWASNKFIYNADVSQLAKCKTTVGISSYANYPNQSFTEIKNCLDNNIIPKIPKDAISKTPIYLGATAGMRMLMYNNPNATDQIMNVIRDSLRKYSLILSDPISDVQIINGYKEGIYGWTTVNYLTGSLPKTIMSTGNLFGALDMGGASAEITFIDQSHINSTGTHVLKLFGNSYSLYSHSYLCYGKSQAEYRFLAFLLEMNKFNTSTINPCMSINQNLTLGARDIFSAPCIIGKFAMEHYGHEIIPPPNWLSNNENVTFVGTSDYSSCGNLVNLLFNTSTCRQEPCTFNGVYQPAVVGKFKAFSAFKLIQKNLNEKNEKIDLYEYESRLKKFCNSKYTQLTYFDSEEDQWVKWKCFDLMYMMKILIKFGFNESNWDRLEFVDQVAGSSLGWALGFMINKTAIMPKEKHFLPIEYSLFVILLIVLLIILAFSITFTYLYFTKNNCSRKCTVYSNFVEEEDLLSPNVSKE